MTMQAEEIAGWEPKPPELLFRIKRYDRERGTWAECAFSDLKRGDIFAPYSPDGSAKVDPVTGDPTDEPEHFARCVRDAEPNFDAGFGYRCEVTVGTLETLLLDGTF